MLLRHKRDPIMAFRDEMSQIFSSSPLCPIVVTNGLEPKIYRIERHQFRTQLFPVETKITFRVITSRNTRRVERNAVYVGDDDGIEVEPESDEAGSELLGNIFAEPSEPASESRVLSHSVEDPPEVDNGNDHADVDSSNAEVDDSNAEDPAESRDNELEELLHACGSRNGE